MHIENASAMYDRLYLVNRSYSSVGEPPEGNESQKISEIKNLKIQKKFSFFQELTPPNTKKFYRYLAGSYDVADDILVVQAYESDTLE